MKKSELASPSRTTPTFSMRGVAGSAGAVAGIAFGIFTVAGAESLVREPAEYGSTGGINDAGPPSTNAMQGTLSRHLQASRQPTVTDDALDPIGTVSIEYHFMYPHHQGDVSGEEIASSFFVTRHHQYSINRCSSYVKILGHALDRL